MILYPENIGPGAAMTIFNEYKEKIIRICFASPGMIQDNVRENFLKNEIIF